MAYGSGVNNGGAVLRTSPKTGHTAVVAGLVGAQDGYLPGKLVYEDGVLYGATYGENDSGNASGMGTLFAINRVTGAKTVIHQFTGAADGSSPDSDIVIHSGIIYGTTSQGGASGDGTLYAFNITSGTMTILATFNRLHANASGVIFQKGILYGTSCDGGKTNNGTIYQFNLQRGTYTTLYSFSGKPDGSCPFGPLTYHDGVLYGLSVYGGTDEGTLFQFNLATKTETVLYNFKGGAQGRLEYVAGTLYGTLTDPNEVFALTP